MKSHSCGDHASCWCDGEGSDAAGDDDGADGKSGADAERGDNGVRFGVVAVLQGLIPAIERLDDRCAEHDGYDRRDEESPRHESRVYHAPDAASVGLCLVGLERKETS